MIKGQLVKKTDGQIGIVIDVHQTEHVEPFNTNKHGITRQRTDYSCSILFGEELVSTKVFYRHNSYQLHSKYYTIGVKPESVWSWAGHELEVMA